VHMATNSRTMTGLSPAREFDVLRAGHSYARRVVGTRAIRSVDAGWPTVGSAALHGRLRTAAQGRTDRVDAVEPDSRLSMQPQAWPAGSVAIVISVAPAGAGCTVTIDEHPDRRFAKLVQNPVTDLMIKVRNIETLRRLERDARSRA